MDYFTIKFTDNTVLIMNGHQLTEFIKTQTLKATPVTYDVLNFINCKTVSVQKDNPTDLK